MQPFLIPARAAARARGVLFFLNSAHPHRLAAPAEPNLPQGER